MNARQRLADVEQLRDDICHGFFNMIIKPGWQDALYQEAHYQVTNNGSFRDSYSDVYGKMRRFDIKNLAKEYKVEDMDVSLMRTVASFWNGKNNRGINYAPMKSQTLNALKNVKEDRNGDGHSPGNEDMEELYLQGLLSLVNLRQFIKVVDKIETDIDDPDRLAYYQKYISEIDSLKDTLDKERIELVQKIKEIDQDIQRIKDSQDPLRTWCDIYKIYSDRASIHRDDDKEEKRLREFCIRASDAGIQYAHSFAATNYIYIFKDPAEAIKRLKMLLESDPELTWQTCVPVIDDINMILNLGHKPTEEIFQLIEYIEKHGHKVELRNERYILLEWEKREKERQQKWAAERQKKCKITIG